MQSYSGHQFRNSLFAVLLLSSCGSATFKESSGSPPKGGAGDIEKPTPPDKITSLTWYWQCNTSPGVSPLTKNGDVVIAGEGSHELNKDSLGTGVPMTIGGRVCPPEKYPRDIVFVIDVSGSMLTRPGNDIPSASTKRCGRIDAVESMISNISSMGGDSRYGLVIFSDDSMKSSALFADTANLYANFSQGKTPESILCSGYGNTNYGKGMADAESLLANGRPGAIKEIYFVSDGAPTDGTAGVDIARRLKTIGLDFNGTKRKVQIATVMLKGSDTASETLMTLASVDKAAVPMHARSADASKLAATLNSFAANEIDDGVIRYRATGTEKWTEIALKPNMKGYDFSVPSFQVTPESAPNGLDVNFEYNDQHNNKYSSGGNIVWTAKKK